MLTESPISASIGRLMTFYYTLKMMKVEENIRGYRLFNFSDWADAEGRADPHPPVTCPFKYPIQNSVRSNSELYISVTFSF